MEDGGFVNGHVKKFQAVVTRAQLNSNYRKELEQTVAETVAQAEVWRPGTKESLVKGVAGRLKLEAHCCELPEPLLPAKLTTPSALVRAKVLKEAAEMLLACL